MNENLVLGKLKKQLFKLSFKNCKSRWHLDKPHLLKIRMTFFGSTFSHLSHDTYLSSPSSSSFTPFKVETKNVLSKHWHSLWNIWKTKLSRRFLFLKFISFRLFNWQISPFFNFLLKHFLIFKALPCQKCLT